MATVEVEIGDNGEIGTLPEPLQKFLNKRIDESYQKGADKAERALKSLVVDPKEIETLRSKAKELEDLQLATAERDKKYDEAREIRDKRHQEELAAEKKATARAQKKLRESVGKAIRSAAVEAGARSESLDELERLIGADVDFDDNLDAFVKDSDGNALTTDKGEKVTLEGFVRDYLDKKPHHKAARPAVGGKAPGGATYRGVTQPPNTKDAHRAALDEDASQANQMAFIRNVLRKGA